MSKMSQRRTIAVAVARKDLTIEWNSKVLVNQVAPFAAIIMVMFAFALDNDGILQRVAPGLVWLATLFSMLVVIQRTFAVESADGALDALRVAGVDTSAIFAGKSVALMVQLATNYLKRIARHSGERGQRGHRVKWSPQCLVSIVAQSLSAISTKPRYQRQLFPA